ncbi:MAG: 1-phosphofructokinase family hexose kinase [Phycisphaerae bacterium]|nr:1-phosphofructokinase family hexose kinase [Phycisphaerae bacterium]
MERILTVTMNPAVDKSTRIRDVAAERKLRCETPVREPGGGGINVSRAIHKLGGTSKALCPAGGPTGEMLQSLLKEEGIELTHVPIEGWTRENLTVFERSTEHQYRFGMPGARLSESEWNACLSRIEEAEEFDFVVCSGSLPPGVPEDFYARVGRVARNIGAKFLLDTSGPALSRAAETGAYLIKPNVNEFQHLTGESLESESQQEKLAKKVISEGICEVLVLSLGAAGVMLATSEGIDRIRSPSVPIRSKVGAGDSMMGAMVLGLARGMDVRSAVRYGVSAGAAAVMTPGSELCRAEDVDHLYRQLEKSGGA